VKEAAKLVATVVGQDLEQRDDGVFRIARRVAKDRVISTVDPEARHGHKTAARGFDGYKGHVAIDPDSEIITATTVTAGNVADGSVADALVADVLGVPPAGVSPVEPPSSSDESSGAASPAEPLLPDRASASANATSSGEPHSTNAEPPLRSTATRPTGRHSSSRRSRKQVPRPM
jgi:hypothetical protein